MQEEIEQHISLAIDQEVNPEAIHQFLNKVTYPVMCQSDLEIVVDNFKQNLVNEPSNLARTLQLQLHLSNYLEGWKVMKCEADILEEMKKKNRDRNFQRKIKLR